MLKTIPLAPGVPRPVSYTELPYRFGKAFRAAYNEQPTRDDVLAFSASLGYGNIARKEGGYIIGEVLIEPAAAGYEAQWECIPD
jgi:hypothetical protein